LLNPQKDLNVIDSPFATTTWIHYNRMPTEIKVAESCYTPECHLFLDHFPRRILQGNVYPIDQLAVNAFDFHSNRTEVLR